MDVFLLTESTKQLAKSYDSSAKTNFVKIVGNRAFHQRNFQEIDASARGKIRLIQNPLDRSPRKKPGPCFDRPPEE